MEFKIEYFKNEKNFSKEIKIFLSISKELLSQTKSNISNITFKFKIRKHYNTRVKEKQKQKWNRRTINVSAAGKGSTLNKENV